MPTLSLPKAGGGFVSHTLPDVAQDVLLLASATQFLSNKSIPNDGLLKLGDAGEVALVNRSTALAANTVLAGVIVGTAATLASAANSLLIGNITASGDIHLIVNKGGNSHTAFFADGSTGDTIINAATGQSVDVYIAGVKEIDYSTGLMAFQQSTTISTPSATSLTFSSPLGHIFTVLANFNDNVYSRFGTDGDAGIILFASSTAADEEVAGLIEGTSNHQGAVTGSLYLSILEDDKDFLVLVSDGGNSIEMIKCTAATAELSLGWGALKIGFGADLAAITRPATVTATAAAIITALIDVGIFTA